MTSDQEQRAIFVTGASTGIGRACAMHLDRLGFRVFATVRNEKDAQSLRAEASPRLTPVLVDVNDEASIASAAQFVEQEVGAGGLYGLLNNAGIGTMAPTECAPLSEIRRIFDVNVFGTVAVTQAMLPLLRRAHGRIANVSSMTSIFPMPFHGPYSASKQALNAFSDALRMELGPHGIHVSILFPGFVLTPTFDSNQYLKARHVVSTFKTARALYGAQYKKAVSYVGGRAKNGITAELAARQMCRVFTDSHPRDRYTAGNDAWSVLLLDRFLSGRLRDWVMLRMVGLSGSAGRP